MAPEGSAPLGALLIATGFLLEGFLVWRSGAVAGPVSLVLAAVWVAVWWCLATVFLYSAAAVARLGSGGVWRVVVAAASAAVPVFWAVSWSVRLGAGRFIDLEGLRFASHNARMVWLFLVQTEGGRLLFLAVSLLAVVSAWTLVVLRVARRPGGTSRGLRLSGLASIVAVGTLMVVTTRAPAPGAGPAAWKLSPFPALVASLLEAEEPVGDCLRLDELVAIDDEPSPRAAPESPSILFVAVESLRADVLFTVHQGRAVMPILDGLAREGLHFRRVWAASTHSDYSDVAALSSTYPLRSRRHHYYRRADPWPRRLVYDLVRPLGYRTAIISAQNEGWGGMDAFLDSPGLELFWDARVAAAEGLPTRAATSDEGFAEAVASGLRAGKLDDSLVTDRALRWLEARARSNERFFLGVNFQSSHFPYELDPTTPRPFVPWRPDGPISFTFYPAGETETVRNAYFNALAYVDEQLSRLLAGLDRLGLGSTTLVVVYGENGEMFHEHGAVTHASQPWEAALRVPMVMWRAGRAAEIVDEPTSLVDLVPTALGLAGIESHPAFQGVDRSQRPIEPRGRALFFHNENPITRVDGVVLDGRWKLWHDREIDRVFLFDLQVDPVEQQELSRREDEVAAHLVGLVEQFRCRQLAYYGNPILFRQAFVPAAPGVPGAAPVR